MATKSKKAQPIERFEYGETQELLRTSAKKLIQASFPSDRVRTLMADKKGYEEKDWKEMAGMGWQGLLVPEAMGGLGLSVFELGVLLEEMGFAVVPGPYLASQLAVLVLLEGAGKAQQKELLPAIAAGERIPTLALFEKDGGWDVAAGAAKAKKAGKNAYTLSGAKLGVLDGQNADLLLVTAQTGKGPTLFAVDARAKGVSITPNVLLDETRRSATVKLTGVKLPAGARLGAEGRGAKIAEAALPRIWTAIAAEMIGATRRVFQISLDYAKVREQFGRPIGSFQGVKHRLVDRMVDMENARSLVYGALWAQDHEKDRVRQVAHMAKAYLSDVGPLTADSAVRTHGGIGFTWECDVHLYWKRLDWGRRAYGDAPFHRLPVGAEIARGAA